MPAKPPARHGKTAGPGLPVELGQAGAFVLGKQGLAGRGLGGLDQAVQTTAGVYGTAPTCYLSFAAKVPGFHLQDLDGALYRDRRLVRVRCMRESSYVVATGMLPVVMAATTGQTERIARRYAAGGGLDDDAFDELTGTIERIMAGHRGHQGRAARPARAGRAARSCSAGPSPPCAQARLVRAEVRGGWRSDTYAYARAYARWADWLGARSSGSTRRRQGSSWPAPTYAPSGRRRPPTWPGGPAGTPGRPLRRWPRSATRSSRSP